MHAVIVCSAAGLAWMARGHWSFGQVGLLDGARSREAIVQCVLNYITNDRSCALTPSPPLLLLFRNSVPFYQFPIPDYHCPCCDDLRRASRSRLLLRPILGLLAARQCLGRNGLGGLGRYVELVSGVSWSRNCQTFAADFLTLLVGRSSWPHSTPCCTYFVLLK